MLDYVSLERTIVQYYVCSSEKVPALPCFIQDRIPACLPVCKLLLSRFHLVIRILQAGRQTIQYQSRLLRLDQTLVQRPCGIVIVSVASETTTRVLGLYWDF